MIKLPVKDKLSPEERLANEWGEIHNQFNLKTARFLEESMKNKDQRVQDLIIGYIKEYMIPLEDKDFMLIYNKEEDKYYITLDFEEGEEVYFTLLDSNKPYDTGLLIDALLREVLRLWRLEKKIKDSNK